MSYQGRAYQAPSGQWSWAISQDGVDIQAGAGYESEDDALSTMEDQLSNYVDMDIDVEKMEKDYQEGVRAHQVRQMVANFRIEGMEPSPEDQALHQAYIADEMTLEDLRSHAIAYALEHGKDDGRAALDHLAAGRWVTYTDEDLLPGKLLREWPDGRMEVVDVDKAGQVYVVRELPSKAMMRKHRKALNAAFANVHLSGFTPSEKMLARAELMVCGDITLDEFLTRRDPAL
jgi:hypothetical protein